MTCLASSRLPELPGWHFDFSVSSSLYAGRPGHILLSLRGATLSGSALPVFGCGCDGVSVRFRPGFPARWWLACSASWLAPGPGPPPLGLGPRFPFFPTPRRFFGVVRLPCAAPLPFAPGRAAEACPQAHGPGCLAFWPGADAVVRCRFRAVGRPLRRWLPRWTAGASWLPGPAWAGPWGGGRAVLDCRGCVGAGVLEIVGEGPEHLRGSGLPSRSSALFLPDFPMSPSP